MGYISAFDAERKKHNYTNNGEKSHVGRTRTQPEAGKKFIQIHTMTTIGYFELWSNKKSVAKRKLRHKQGTICYLWLHRTAIRRSV
jgi:hypothetical protein